MKEKYIMYTGLALVFIVLFYFWRKGAGGFAKMLLPELGM